jgi:DNA-directed RNA polymerase specialized sigma24 family protein
MAQADPAARADVSDFEVFHATCKDRVLRAVVASTGDAHDAEDCTAEAFARAYAHWEDVRDGTVPAAWVVRTAVNLHIDRYRRHQRTLRLLPTLAEDDHMAAPPLPIHPILPESWIRRRTRSGFVGQAPWRPS